LRQTIAFAAAVLLALLSLARAEQAGSTQPAASPPAPTYLSQVRVADLPDWKLDRVAWSKPRTRDGVEYRRAHGGNVFVSLPNFWGHTPNPPAGLYAIDITHFDNSKTIRTVKIYSGGGEQGFRHIGFVGGPNTRRLITDTILVDAEDIVTAAQFNWQVQILFARSRPIDLVSIGIRNATDHDFLAAVKMAQQLDRQALLARAAGPPGTGVIEPGESFSYRPADLECIAQYRDYQAGKNRDLFRLFNIYYVMPTRSDQPIVHPATQEELEGYEQYLKTITTASAPTAMAPIRLPYKLMAVIVKKPPQLDLPAPSPSSGVIAFSRPIHSPISRIYTKPTQTDVQSGLTIRLAKNEWEGAPVLVWSQTQRQNLRLRVAPLEQQGQPFQGQTRIHQVTVAPVGIGSAKVVQPLYWWPQPKTGLTVGADRTAIFWLDLFADPAAKPGAYSGFVEVLGQDQQVLARMPLTVELLPIELISTAECPYRMGFLSGMLPAPRMQQILIDHNCNTFAVFLDGTPPLVRVTDKSTLDVDFDNIDRQLRHAHQLGIAPVIFFMSSRPAEFPLGLYLEKALLRAQLVAERKISRKPDTRIFKYLGTYFSGSRDQVGPPVRELLRQWLKLVAQHADQAPWPQLAFCPMDQPRNLHNPKYQWTLSRYDDTAKLIADTAQGRLKVFGLIRDRYGEVLLDYCDLACASYLTYDPVLAEQARQHRSTLWAYATCKPDATLTHARFLAGAHPMQARADGLLFWALEWGRNTAWRYIAGRIVHNAVLLGIREGGDDRRYAETLLRVAEDTDAARDLIDSLIEPTREISFRPLDARSPDYYQQNLRHVELLNRLRSSLADEIIRLTTPAD